ncbi:MAG: dockerin type I domain-containing protein [Clostridiales bacterium]|nr:dockerin type I domain-containing protein [Clostridiales bacterium]
MNKKLSSVFIAIILILSAFCGVFVASADEKPTFTLDTVEASVGETASVCLRVSNNPGITAFRVVITFDTSAIELTDVEFGDAASGYFTGTSQNYGSPYSVSGFSAVEDISTNGILVTYTFKVLTSVEGSYSINLTYDSDDVFNLEGDSVDFEAVNGSVTVLSCSHEFTSEIITEPTSDSEGLLKYTCINCGYSYTEVIPMLSSVYTVSGTAVLAENSKNDSPNGYALENVSVYVNDELLYVTDEDGFFSFDLENGDYTLKFEYSCGFDESLNVTVNSDDVSLGEVQITGLDFVRDGYINAKDFAVLTRFAYGYEDGDITSFDLNNDGKCDELDMQIFRNYISS